MPQQKTDSLGNEYRYSVLEISQQKFGVEVLHVLEVLPMPKITPVPNVHRSILGVFNLRGQIHSLLDLRVLFHLEQTAITADNYVVLIKEGDMTMGVLVDRVLDLVLMDAAKMALPTQDMAGPYIQYTSGVYEHTTMGVIYILDLNAILNAKEIYQYRFV